MMLELIEKKSAADVHAEPVSIAAGQTEIDVPLRIDAQREPGSSGSLRFRATGDLDGKSTIVTEATVRLRFER
jgi:hypothetical protein